MRVGFDKNINIKEGDSGKYKFLIRLASAMRRLGVKVTSRKPDVYLRLPGSNKHKKAKINVLRLDGLWFNIDQNYKKRNKTILRCVKKSDALVYQGVFCRDAYKKFWGVSKSEYRIIPNGADPDEFLDRKVGNFFLACCRWRPHKRLKDITKSFLLALEKGLDSDLIVAGQPEAEDTVNHERIRYIGWQKTEQLRDLLSVAIASVHLTWLDWCPNAIVESIVAGCPVIFSKSGGHPELVRDNGIGIDDTPWDFKACRLYKPPKIDREKVSDIFIQMKNNRMQVDSSYLQINNIAERYISYFKELMNK